MQQVFTSQTTNSRLFDTLFETAKTAYTFNTSRHSAAIVYKRKIIATGVSQIKTHPLQKKYGIELKEYLHAEVAAIVNAINLHGSDILQYCSIYCLRITNTEKIGISKPCAGCMRAIEAFKIRKIYWTENE